jgi:hypothetical protein
VAAACVVVCSLCVCVLFCILVSAVFVSLFLSLAFLVQWRELLIKFCRFKKIKINKLWIIIIIMFNQKNFILLSGYLCIGVGVWKSQCVS